MSAHSTTHPVGPSHLLLRVRNALGSALNELRLPSAKRIPFLDGLRTLAVLLVVNHHVAGAFDESYAPTRYTSFPLTVNGWMGVDLFFVLSGFFIGSQLWKELTRTGTIKLREFMLRRTLRIWPLYFFTFAVVLPTLPHFGAGRQYGWTDIVFLVNYLGGGVVLGGWSLSTEEQFYLVAPLLLLLFRGHTLRWFRWLLGGLWLLEIGVRIAEYVRMAGHWRVKDSAAFGQLYYPFHTHSDGLIAGLLIANLVVAASQPGARKWTGLLARPWLVLALGVAGMGVCWKLQSETLNFAGLGLLFGSVVWWGIHTHPQWLSSRFFYLGSRLSFGMYLNHPYLIRPVTQLVVSLHPHLPPPAWAAPLIAAVVACLSVAISFVTFCLIEHPFLLLRTVMLRKKEVVSLVAH